MPSDEAKIREILSSDFTLNIHAQIKLMIRNWFQAQQEKLREEEAKKKEKAQAELKNQKSDDEKELEVDDQILM